MLVEQWYRRTAEVASERAGYGLPGPETAGMYAVSCHKAAYQKMGSI